jgi:glucose-1-phosphate cytidylyltransferase
MTGARIARAASRYLGTAEHFAVTYGDGLCNVDLLSELDAHVTTGAVGTVLAINPPSRFGELRMQSSQVVEFAEKPELSESWINGGYFLFHRKFLEYLSPAEDCVLEQSPLRRLSENGELHAFRHNGFWACMDTQRDKENLDEIWNSGRAPWALPG